MFEDFSFSSRRPPRLTFDSDGDDSVMVDTDNDSTLISPLSSRCSSPQPSQRFPRSLPLRHPHAHAHGQHLPPTSVPFAYDHRRLSMGTLTRKLHEHTLRQPGDDNNTLSVNVKPGSQYQGTRQRHEDGCLSPRSVPDLVPGSSTPASASASESRRFLGYFVTPPDTDHDEDDHDDDDEEEEEEEEDGKVDVDDASLFPSLSSSSSLLVPSDTPGRDAQTHQALNVRAQRQQISRLQCNPTDIETLRRALFSADDDDSSPTDAFGFGPDDCHPSSLLPPRRRSPRRRAVAGNRSQSRPASGSSGCVADHGAYQYQGRRKSSSGMSMSSSMSASSSHRIDKGYYPSSREMRKKSEQGLRRKSLVSAALASMVDRTL